jgi:hypothetical protein
MVNSAQPGEGGRGVHAFPLSIYLPSRAKLWCTLQLRGQIHCYYFSSTVFCLCVGERTTVLYWIQRKTWFYAGIDYNLTLCPLQSRLQHVYHGQPYARVDLNPMPESTLSPSQGLWIWNLYFFILYVIRFRTYKISWPPQDENLGEEGASDR